MFSNHFEILAVPKNGHTAQGSKQVRKLKTGNDKVKKRVRRQSESLEGESSLMIEMIGLYTMRKELRTIKGFLIRDQQRTLSNLEILCCITLFN